MNIPKAFYDLYQPPSFFFYLQCRIVGIEKDKQEKIFSNKLRLKLCQAQVQLNLSFLSLVKVK